MSVRRYGVNDTARLGVIAMVDYKLLLHKPRKASKWGMPQHFLFRTKNAHLLTMTKIVRKTK